MLPGERVGDLSSLVWLAQAIQQRDEIESRRGIARRSVHGLTQCLFRKLRLSVRRLRRGEHAQVGDRIRGVMQHRAQIGDCPGRVAARQLDARAHAQALVVARILRQDLRNQGLGANGVVLAQPQTREIVFRLDGARRITRPITRHRDHGVILRLGLGQLILRRVNRG
jgi:hypothetical protein